MHRTCKLQLDSPSNQATEDNPCVKRCTVPWASFGATLPFKSQLGEPSESLCVAIHPCRTSCRLNHTCPVARNFPESDLPVSVLVFVWSAFAFRLELAARLCLCNIMIARSSKHQARTQPSQVTCCCVSPADGGIITASKKTFEDTISVCDRDKQKLRHSHPPVSP